MPETQPQHATLFPETRWTLVLRANDGGQDTLARRALGELIEGYWFPLYRFARQRGLSPEDAEDRTQGFFASLIERDALQSVAPENGKLRAFLLASLKNFLASEWRKESAQKRGGGQSLISIDQNWAEDRIALEPASPDAAPDELFDCCWARTILDRVFEKLRQRYVADGRGVVFDTLRDSLWGDEARGTHEKHAEELGISNEAVRAAASRLRKRFRQTLEGEILDTVADHSAVEEEVAYLCEALARR